MIRQVLAQVLSTEEITTGMFVTWYRGEEVAQGATPGQFVMVQPQQGTDPFLPRAFSFYRFRERRGEQEWALLYAVVGEATGIMAAQRPGDTVLATGPLGQGFSVKPGAGNLLLVGGGVGVAPLVTLADEQIATGKSLMLALGARTAADVYPADLLPPEVEYVVSTEDGSMGLQGMVTDLFAQHLAWADQSLACGPVPMFRGMAEVVRKDGMRRSVQILMETEMGCGTGICYGCAVFTKKGVKLCCRDGPRFELQLVF